MQHYINKKSYIYFMPELVIDGPENCGNMHWADESTFQMVKKKKLTFSSLCQRRKNTQRLFSAKSAKEILSVSKSDINNNSNWRFNATEHYILILCSHNTIKY